MRGAFFKRSTQAQFFTKNKNFFVHPIENWLEIILGIKIFEEKCQKIQDSSLYFLRKIKFVFGIVVTFYFYTSCFLVKL